MAKRKKQMMTHMICLKLNHMSHPMKMIVMNLTLLTMNRCLRRFARGQIHLSLKKKQLTVGSLANEEDHMVKPNQTPESLSMVKVVQRHVRRDRVDEECARLGIVYKKWKPLNPKQKSHPSVRDIDDSTVIPDEQEVPEWCILCPRNKYLRDNTYAQTHYFSMHHKKLLVVDNVKMLACKCSEIHSHGSNRSARNLHFHCSLCYHPFKSGDLLATHMLCHHTDIMLSQVRHLMRASNPHRSYDYENDD